MDEKEAWDDINMYCKLKSCDYSLQMNSTKIAIIDFEVDEDLQEEDDDD